jgi:hypothetical protein
MLGTAELKKRVELILAVWKRAQIVGLKKLHLVEEMLEVKEMLVK